MNSDQKTTSVRPSDEKPAPILRTAEEAHFAALREIIDNSKTRQAVIDMIGERHFRELYPELFENHPLLT